jgi:hypothetical protein
MQDRQICWSHLIRKFVSFAERSGPAGNLGEDLLFWCTPCTIVQRAPIKSSRGSRGCAGRASSRPDLSSTALHAPPRR